MNGLNINNEEFKSLNAPQQRAILFENLNHVKSLIGRYKFHQKIHYVWLSVLTTGALFILRNLL